MSRYARQVLLPQIGPAGQERLGRAHVLIVGCGALGCHAADQLARAGVGRISIADRDLVELSNLQRQTLFDESDIGQAKAQAAAKRLCRVNSQITIVPLVLDVWAANVEHVLESVDLILDGTDNVQTRYLLNDAAVKCGQPWIHAACVGTEGRVMVVSPDGACLRCVFPDPPPAASLPTCDTAGIMQPAAAAVASLQVAQAIKLLTGNWTAAEQQLWRLDVWSGRVSTIHLADAKNADCPCCGRREFNFLQSPGDSAIALCGRDTVQIRPARAWSGDELQRALAKLKQAGELKTNGAFSRCTLYDPGHITITCFTDGRLLVHGTSDTGRAKSLVARYIGA